MTVGRPGATTWSPLPVKVEAGVFIKKQERKAEKCQVSPFLS